MIFEDTYFIDIAINEWIQVQNLPTEIFTIFNSNPIIFSSDKLIDRLKEIYKRSKKFIDIELNENKEEKFFDLNISISKWYNHPNQPNYLYIFKEYKVCKGKENLSLTLTNFKQLAEDFIEKLIQYKNNPKFKQIPQ